MMMRASIGVISGFSVIAAGIPNWKNNIFVGGMRQGEVPRSGHLERIDFNGKWESMLHQIQQRIRGAPQGPDGLLYVLTAENDGALIGIEPGGRPASPGAR